MASILRLLEQRHQLLELLALFGLSPLAIASATQQAADPRTCVLDLAERGSDRLDLMEDVDAVAIVLDHLRHTAHLPFDPVELDDFRGSRLRPESD